MPQNACNIAAMTPDIFLALLIFAAASVFTPGPNNLMLMTSGANYGLRRSLPHMAGVAYGLPLMILPVGLGVMQLFDMWPPAYTVLKVASVGYMLWLAWKIANAAAPGEKTATGQPLTFWQAAGFQWVNPKAWSMSLGAITLYATTRDLASVLWVAGAFAFAGTFSATTWTTLGTALRQFLSEPRRLRVFNWTMAGLLILSMVPVLLG